MDSSIEDINESMPEISDTIVQGDKDYNESVKLLNQRNFYDASQKAEDAEDNYNRSLEDLSNILDKYDKDLNDVHKEYIGTAINELELKLKAIDELKESIYYLENYYNYTGSTHGTEANELMYDAVQYQNERNGIVQDNKELFT